MDGKILFQGVFPKDSVSCTYSSVSSRKIDKNIENKAQQIWQLKLEEALKNGKKMWDQPVCRLDGYVIHDNKCKLEFSTVPFSIRSSIGDFTDELIRKGDEYLPMATYSSIFIETSNAMFVFGEKSDFFAASRKYSYIGGVFNKPQHRKDVDLFKSAQNEVLEETGVVESDIEKIELIGAFRTKSYNVAFIFYCKLKLTKDEVVSRFKKRNDSELKNLFFGNKDEVKNIGINIIGKESELIDIFDQKYARDCVF
ncbi:hypothetical protein IPM62_05930 [Candidatus Woesebacteria bacterium]|nr:MAG: hypothetical protein IPM62_05930 [Candidatus Woesebacteria bacterium]